MPYGIAEMKARSKTRIIKMTEHICVNAVDGFLLRCGLLPCQAVVLAVSVFSDFAYHREATTADGLSVVLEFSAKVGDKRVKGIDFIRFDEDGRIVDFEVMMRPLSGVQAMAEEMGKRLGAILPAFKGD